MWVIFNTMNGWYVIALILLVTAFIKVYACYNYWNKRDVYAWKPTFPFGNAKDVVMQKIHFGFDITELYTDIKSRSKKFGGYYSVFTPIFIPVDLSLIKQILTSSDSFTDRSSYVDDENDPLSANMVHLHGERWRRIRAIILPSFTRYKLKTAFQLLMNKTYELVAVVDETVKKMEPLNVKELLDGFMIDMIGLYILGIQLNLMKNTKSEVKHYLKNFFNSSSKDALIRFLMTSPHIQKFFKVKLFSTDMTNFFTKYLNEIIKYRKLKENDTKVLLDTLTEHENSNSREITVKLERNEIIANLTILLLAGYDTTSNTLTFCLYELSCNKKLQDNVRLEINAMFYKCNNNPTYEAISELIFLEQCINETLRKHSVSTVVTRTCTKQFNVPGSNLVLQEGSQVYIPIRGIHWDPEYYPNPQIFDPERFSKACIRNRNPLTFIPFGSGPRHCAGFRFAMLNLKITLAIMLKNFEFSLNCESNSPLEFDPKAFILQPKPDILLNVKRLQVS